MSRAHCSVGDTLADHRLCPSIPPRSGRCLRHKCHVLRSPLHKSLWERRKERGGDMGGEKGEGGKIQNVIVKKSSHTSLPCLTGQWKEFLELITLILPDNKNLISILQKKRGTWISEVCCDWSSYLLSNSLALLKLLWSPNPKGLALPISRTKVTFN